MAVHAQRRWIRSLVCSAVVLVALPWAQSLGSPAPASAGTSQDRIYVAPFIDNIDSGDVLPAEKEAIASSVQKLVAQQLAKKYPCASVTTSADLEALLGHEKTRELLGATTPEEEAQILESITAAAAGSTFVFGSYAMAGGTLSVTVNVIDTATAQVVDTSTVTVQSDTTGAFLDLPDVAADKLTVGLCQAYWVGSITIMDDDNGASKTGGPGVGASNVTLTSHMLEGATLIPPLNASQTGGDIGQASALIRYQRSDATQSSDVQGYLDSCNARLRNLTFTLQETSSTKAQDSWKDPVWVELDQGSGTYTIEINGRDMESQITATKKYTAFSKAPCAKPPAPSAVISTETLSATNWELTGKLNPKNPYKLTGHASRTDTALGMTNTLNESWSLTLKHPPKSGTS